MRLGPAGVGRRLTRWGLSVLFVGGPVLFLPTVGSAQLAAGQLVREPKYGFTMRLPVKWNVVPLDGSDITSLLNAATHDDPSLTNALNSEIKTAATEGIKVFAVGPLAGSFVPNVNVIIQSSAGVPSGHAFPAAASVQAKISLGEAGIKKIRATTVHDRVGVVAQVAYVLPLKTGDAYGEQIYAEHGSHLAIMTVTTASAGQSLSISRAIAGSWHWA